MIVTKQQVIAALATMRAGRSRAYANRAIRSILRQFGNGATNITELDPAHYAAVIAAVALPTLADHYGTITDAVDSHPPRTTEPPRPSGARKSGGENSPTALITPPRIRSPLTLALEAELAKARAKTKRSVPGGRVDIGAPAQFGDEDAAREYPSDGRKMS